jgi:transposase
MLRRSASKVISEQDEYYYKKTIRSDHLLRRIAETIDFSFVREVLADCYSPDQGRPAEDPILMFKICLLEYLYGLSDVQVIEQIQVNLAYRWFLGIPIDDPVPDDSTVSYFRVKRVGLKKFQKIFQQIVHQCIEEGLISRQSKRGIIDSTHIIADVAIPTWLSLVRQAYKQVVYELVFVNEELAVSFEQKLESLWNDLKGKKRDEKLPQILELANELVKEAESFLIIDSEVYSPLYKLKKVIGDRNDSGTDRLISVVDPEARTGHKSRTRTIQGYKDHIMIDEESELITALKVTPANAEDGDQLIDLVTQFQEDQGIMSREITADKAYWSGKNLRFLHENNQIGHISCPKTKQQTAGLFGPENFQFDPVKMEVICPNGEISTSYRDQPKKQGIEFKFKKSQCHDCPLREKCTHSKTIRTVFISEYQSDLKRGRKHYQTDSYKEGSQNRYRVERRHADKVRNHGLRRSRYRGLERTWIHSLLSSIASNVKRMSKLILEREQQDPSVLLPA